ncbi:MAG: hypothetical protein BWY76_03270 [bacterium ADurb.Bin429]|nr:MAG: hypothetical protein BWY76_03270 [bacterium ADurb.Bin429]
MRAAIANRKTIITPTMKGRLGMPSVPPTNGATAASTRPDCRLSITVLVKSGITDTMAPVKATQSPAASRRQRYGAKSGSVRWNTWCPVPRGCTAGS